RIGAQKFHALALQDLGDRLDHFHRVISFGRRGLRPPLDSPAARSEDEKLGRGLRPPLDSPAARSQDEKLVRLRTRAESQRLTAELLGDGIPAERSVMRGAVDVAMATLDRLRLQHGARPARLE